MPVPRGFGGVARLTRVARRASWLLLPAIAIATTTFGAPTASAAGTPWGSNGAAYSGGIVCRLPHGTTVPLSRWSVGGVSTFATADIGAKDGRYGNAPIDGASAPIAAGQAGLSASHIAAIAYLVGHHGSGSAAEIAETSADIAAASGGGRLQARCLGQRGTSARHAAALWTQAQHYAGPYTLTVPARPQTATGLQVSVSTKVVSADGYATPGIKVTFAAGTQAITGTTGGDGRARATLGASAATTSFTATISEPTTLTYFATAPAAVALARPSTYTGASGALSPPRPVISVGASAQLLLPSGTTRPTAQVTGTNGYSGAGSVTVAGPAQPAAATTCSSLTADDFASAPAVWTVPFTFVGDGAYRAAPTPHLAPGCYAVTGSVTTTNSRPTVSARSAFDTGAMITVSTIRLTESTGSGIAPPGPLSATVTATTPGQAGVVSSITEYGPLAPVDGQCRAVLAWGDAGAAEVSASIALSSLPMSGSSRISPPASDADGQPLTARIVTAPVKRLGCYALRLHSVITQDGQTLVVDSAIGKAGSTTLVLRPTLTIADSTYDGYQGKPMTGIIAVAGAYNYPGILRIGLRASAASGDSGCQEVTFAPCW